MKATTMKSTPIIGLFLFFSCQQQPLLDQFPLKSIRIEHYWQDSIIPPEGMRILLYSYQNIPGTIMQNIQPILDSLLLIPGTYRMLCFSNDSEFLRVRNETSWKDAQVYIPTTTRLYVNWLYDGQSTDPGFYAFASNQIHIDNNIHTLMIRADNLIRTFHCKALVEGISEIAVCKAYLEGMVGARTLYDGSAVGGSGTQKFNFQLSPWGIEVRLPTLGPFPEQAYTLNLEFIYTNGAVQRYSFRLSPEEFTKKIIQLPDIQLPTQAIGGGASDGFQGIIETWGWTSVPILLE